MPLDPYSMCPCGSGKKLKFCCSDLTGEMDKIQKMLEGEQPTACLEHIRSLETKYPGRASLWGLRAMLEIELGRLEDARATVDKFVAEHPNNPVALAERTMLVLETDDARAAIEPLQDALDALGDRMPARLYEAVASVGQALLFDEEWFAARRHLLFCAGISHKGERNQEAIQWILRFNADGQIPLLLKDPPAVVSAAQGVAWQAACNECVQLEGRGRWRAAAAKIEEAIATFGDVPELWRNKALLKGFLADNAAAVEALRKWASFDLPLDDAVEAEALAQLLDQSDNRSDQIETVRVTFNVDDVESLEETLAADGRAESLPRDPALLKELSEEGEPPPRSHYFLLDRPKPSTGVGLARADAPRLLGQVLVYGKQTDRPAQLQLVVNRDEQFDDTLSTLREVSGNTLDKPAEEEVLGHTPPTDHLLIWKWRLPADTPPSQRDRMVEEYRREAIFERWPNLAFSSLAGRTAAEAAKDSDSRTAVLAAVLLLELSDRVQASRLDLNELRSRLGLPIAEPIDPSEINAAQLPLARVPRLVMDKVSDDSLLRLYRRVAAVGARRALQHVAREVVRRESLKDKVDRAEAYGLLARCALDIDEELDCIQQASRIAVQDGQSPSEWYLTELTLQIERRDGAEVARLVNLIRDNYLNEEGVPEALLQILYAAGIVDPQGRPLQAAEQQSAGIVVPGEEQSTSKIWTPGGQSGGTGKKPAIWTP